jgi:excinuclease ABC subunit C
LSSYAVRDTLVQIQKLFKIRTCRDEFFKHRTRPCLEYQIKRCSGPCVALITPDEYQKDLESAHRMLAGRSDELAQDLGRKMEAAAQALEYERAAQFRDQILALRQVREKRSITGGAEDLDVVVIALHPAHSCVVLMTVREGLNLGHRSFFPKHAPHVEADELLESFLNQHYQQFIPPPEIVLSHDLDEEDAAWLLARFKEKAGKKVKLITNPRGDKQKILDMAGQTAQQALAHFLAEAASMDERLLELAQALELDAPPQRMECFDISHNQGDKTVASCVVFGPMGPMKQAYRKYNIEGITGGDDYAAIHQAISRRFAKGENLPDVLFIDGGQGQLNAALKALEGVDCPLRVVAIAKGPTRRAGMEELLMPEREFPLRLPPDSSALHLIQHIRDESHRFALMGHRARLEKARTTSSLEAIEGLGPARRKALLKSFGGVSAIKRASVEEIAQVEGINRTLAERIFAYFR